MSDKPLSPKAAALAALANALDQVARPVMSAGALRALIVEAAAHVDGITEGRPGRRKKRDTIPAEEIPL